MDGSSAPILAFSTLGCPEWDAETVVRHAATMGYGGIEWRGGDDGTVRTAWSAARRRSLTARQHDAGLRAVAVTAYTNPISGNSRERSRSDAALSEHVELAADLGAGAVRVFLGIVDDEASETELADRAVAALARGLDAARGSGVRLAIEPHDDHVTADRVRPILDAIPDPALGVVWDVANAWAAGERPEDGLAAYGGRIVYVQVKDGTGRGPTWRLTAIGSGEVPLAPAIRAAARTAAEAGLPAPSISVEWERAWHDHLAPPEEALPEALAWLRSVLPEASAGEWRAEPGPEALSSRRSVEPRG